MIDNGPPRALDTVGNYDLLEKIADGTTGTVYKARHWQTKQIVALKVLAQQVAENPILLKRFQQEFLLARQLDHPHIVRVVEYCGTGAAPFIAMEFVDGETLGTRLGGQGRMAEAEAVAIIIQVAQGLQQAHRQGLIHRDIKPDNILVTRDGTAKLIDLGLAKALDGAAELTRTGRGLGTPVYMAPEQFRDAKNASIRCDIYSLAATLYQMVTGELPFGIADPVQILMRKTQNELVPPRHLVPDLSERLERAIMRAMSASPESRPYSCQEFIADLTGAKSAARGSAGQARPGLPTRAPLAGPLPVGKSTEAKRPAPASATPKQSAALPAGPHSGTWWRVALAIAVALVALILTVKYVPLYR